MAGRMRLIGAVASATFVALLAGASAASAATLFVDAGTGSDTANNCQTQASPCQTITWAVGHTATTSDTIKVDDDVYSEHVALSNSLKLTGQNFVAADSGDVRVFAPAGQPALDLFDSSQATGMTLEPCLLYTSPSPRDS